MRIFNLILIMLLSVSAIIGQSKKRTLTDKDIFTQKILNQSPESRFEARLKEAYNKANDEVTNGVILSSAGVLLATLGFLTVKNSENYEDARGVDKLFTSGNALIIAGAVFAGPGFVKIIKSNQKKKRIIEEFNDATTYNVRPKLKNSTALKVRYNGFKINYTF